MAARVGTGSRNGQICPCHPSRVTGHDRTLKEKLSKGGPEKGEPIVYDVRRLGFCRRAGWGTRPTITVKPKSKEVAFAYTTLRNSLSQKSGKIITA